jgi:hypothetical protein
LQPFTHLEGDWLEDLFTQGILQPWTPAVFGLNAGNHLSRRAAPTPYAIAPAGMSAIAKVLAQGLSIQRQCRVTQILPVEQGWQLLTDTATDSPEPLVGRSLLLAMPAAQIPPLFSQAIQQQPALSAWVAAANTVEFEPVITVMAGYAPALSTALAGQPPSPQGWMVFADDHAALGWVGLDSSKRPQAPYPVVVLHSSATFAQQHLDASDLPAIGQRLLTLAAQPLGPWLATPDWLQVHRWRYGLVKRPYPTQLWATTEVPSLVGCGDWCGGTGVEAAISSGRAAATSIEQWLSTRA